MTQFTDIARPYAKAAFLFAHEKNASHPDVIREWQVFLESAAQLAATEQIRQCLLNPNISQEKKLVLFQAALSAYLDKHRTYFLQLLGEKERLNVLPDISFLFNEEVARLENITKVRMVSAVLPDEKYKERLIDVLKKRFNTHIALHCEVDPTVLGGALLYINDAVIDGSVRGQLSRLFQTLVS